MVEEKEPLKVKNSKPPWRTDSATPLPYAAIAQQDDTRILTSNTEFDRVIGGGIVPGSVVLLGGEPGVGKSTLLLQIADYLGQVGKKVLYISGEESEKQIKMRGERLGIRGEHLLIFSETCVETILDEVNSLKPDALILDSVQTSYTQKLESSPGSVSQVRQVAADFLQLAKTRTIPVFLIGHVTKDGSIAGPKTMEHIVDTVLYFEGERHHNHRIVRAVKNRYGAANELGIFEMTGRGLLPVRNPSELFLAERPVGSSGSVVMCCMEGTRPLMVEIQSLVSHGNYSTGRRMTTGIEYNRVSLLLAMIDKRLGLHLIGSDVYVNAAGGITVDEPAADLAVVAAIISSFKNLPIDVGAAVFGEVGLSGEVRATSQAILRAREAAAMGFKRCIMPKSNLPLIDPPANLEIIGIKTVSQLIEHLFL